MKTENVQPKDEPRTKVCPWCENNSDDSLCPVCNGEGETAIFIEDDDYYFDEVKADDERIPD